jgi:urease accessory protein
MDGDDETYILLLLADSNLPTGSFVASAGLESYVSHGFLSKNSTIIDFVRDSLETYARMALPFVSDAHRVIAAYTTPSNQPAAEEIDSVLSMFAALDNLYEAMTLNHVARRASKAQGIALLALYSKGFSRPASLSQNIEEDTRAQESRLSTLLGKYKLRIRREEAPGHLPVCWGILTGALGLTLGQSYQVPLPECIYMLNKFLIHFLQPSERSQFLHLFLHTRSLLSASVRLNDIGPYGAQQILLHAVRPLVAAEAAKCRDLRTGELPEERAGFDQATQGPANTWPLGEILAARHDQQHSRIFNS